MRLDVVLPRRIVQPRPVRRLLSATETPLGATASNAQMKVIVVTISARRLVEDPGRTHHRLRRAFVARGIAKQTSFELVRAKEPLHPGFLVHDQATNEMPVSRLVEDPDPLV